MKILERIDWTNTLLNQAEKQAVEDILAEYHDIFAGHRLHNGMNTEFNVKHTPKDEKALYNQNMPMLIHLKGDLIFEPVLMPEFGIITVLHFSRYASPILHSGNPTENNVSLWI